MKAAFKHIAPVLLLFFLAGCQREINWHLPATGTLKDGQGMCMPALVKGTFHNGVAPGKDTAYIELKVNVFTAGTYFIATDVQNGLRFADSGTFSSSGLHTIQLKPIGTPLAPVPTDYTICFDTSCCPLSLTVTDADTSAMAVNSWRFTDADKHITYQGAINATYHVVTSTTLLSLRKETTSPTDTSFEISIVFPDKNITTGVFKTDTLNSVSLATQGICVNCAWQVAYKFYGVISTINVTGYDPQTKIIKGTFGGTTIDWKNNVAPIKDGIFRAVIKE